MKHTRTFLLAGLSILAMSLTVGGNLSAEKGVEFVVADSVGDYYASITDDMTGTTLLNALNALNNQKRTSTVGYAGMRTFAKFSDADPNGSGRIISFYDNQLIGPNWDGGDTWNREHVWPNIRGGNKVEMDAHMVRPSATATNSNRGSKGYGVESYDPGQFVEYYRGSASRIIFYAAMADLSLHLVDDPLNYNGAGQYPDSMGSISEMLAWNLQYQPTGDFTGANDIARRTEINRNNVIQTHSSGQGNRNPFIDHPEYACRIWGQYNDATRAACNVDPLPPVTPDPDMTGLTLDIHSKAIEIGESFKLTATVTPGELNGKVELDWYSDDESIASFKDGVVTGKKNGTTEIVVCTIDGVFQDRCEVVVGTGVADKPKSKGGCSGNVVTSSIILTVLSFIGIDLIVFKKIVKKKDN